MTRFQPDWAVHPGEVIREALTERQMTQADLARRCGLTEKHISQVCTGKAGLGTFAATQIERAIGLSARTLLRMQADYNLMYHRGPGT